MATTTNLALPYPALTDSPNVPRDIKALADDVDAKMQLRAVAANTDVLAPYSGQLVFNLTDMRAYRYTGSAWVALNPNMPACLLVNNTDQPITGSTPTWLKLAVVNEQTTIAGNTMAATGSGGTASANSPTITIREAGLYEIGLRCTFATDASNGAPVKVIGITLDSTSASMTRGTTIISANAPTQDASVQTEGQGVTATTIARLSAGGVLRPVCVASGGTFINSTSTTFAVGGPARFWAHKIRD